MNVRSNIKGNCFLSPITVLLPFFNWNVIVLAVIGTNSFNSPWSILSFQELLTFGSSNITNIVLQNDIIFKYITVPIEPSINLSETFMLSVNINLAPTNNLNFASRPMLWAIDTEQVFASTSLLAWALTTLSSDFSFQIESSFFSRLQNYLVKPLQIDYTM